MCKRTTTDPLVRAFLDTYHLNLLAVPRADAAPGDVYVETERGLSAPGRFANVLRGAFELPPVRAGEPIADLSVKLSRALDLKVGLGLLETFLAAVGAAGLIEQAKAGYARAGIRTVRVRLRDARRDSMDPLAFGARLAGGALDLDNPLVRAARRFYVTTAVVRTSSLSILGEDDAAQAVDVELGALQSSAGAKASVSREAMGELTYRGDQALAIGVELFELAADEAGRLTLNVPADAVRVRAAAGASPMPAPVLVGGEAGDAFLRLAP
jgi:hypothetical protein